MSLFLVNLWLRIWAASTRIVGSIPRSNPRKEVLRGRSTTTAPLRCTTFSCNIRIVPGMLFWVAFWRINYSHLRRIWIFSNAWKHLSFEVRKCWDSTPKPATQPRRLHWIHKIRMSEGYILYYYRVCVVFVCVLALGECFSNSCSFHRKDTAFSSGLEFVMGFVLELWNYLLCFSGFVCLCLNVWNKITINIKPRWNGIILSR